MSYSNSVSVVICGNSFLILINSLIKLVPVYDETIIKMKNHQTPITIWLDIVTKYMSERHINAVKPYHALWVRSRTTRSYITSYRKKLPSNLGIVHEPYGIRYEPYRMGWKVVVVTIPVLCWTNEEYTNQNMPCKDVSWYFGPRILFGLTRFKT